MTGIDFTAMDDQFATELMQRVFPVVSNLGVNGFNLSNDRRTPPDLRQFKRLFLNYLRRVVYSTAIRCTVWLCSPKFLPAPLVYF